MSSVFLVIEDDDFDNSSTVIDVYTSETDAKRLAEVLSASPVQVMVHYHVHEFHVK